MLGEGWLQDTRAFLGIACLLRLRCGLRGGATSGVGTKTFNLAISHLRDRPSFGWSGLPRFSTHLTSLTCVGCYRVEQLPGRSNEEVDGLLSDDSDVLGRSCSTLASSSASLQVAVQEILG